MVNSVLPRKEAVASRTEDGQLHLAALEESHLDRALGRKKGARRTRLHPQSGRRRMTSGKDKEGKTSDYVILWVTRKVTSL